MCMILPPHDKKCVDFSQPLSAETCTDRRWVRCLFKMAAFLCFGPIKIAASHCFVPILIAASFCFPIMILQPSTVLFIFLLKPSSVLVLL